jgi:preprotein translocase subunit SecG
MDLYSKFEETTNLLKENYFSIGQGFINIYKMLALVYETLCFSVHLETIIGYKRLLIGLLYIFIHSCIVLYLFFIGMILSYGWLSRKKSENSISFFKQHISKSFEDFMNKHYFVFFYLVLVLSFVLFKDIVWTFHLKSLV